MASSTDQDADTNKKGPRKFPVDIEDKCWAKAFWIPGRDPSRWRYDVAGNPVFKDFRGKQGL
jgi:hypothetical protein